MTHDVTYRLTVKNRDQLRNPTLSNRVWATIFVSTWGQTNDIHLSGLSTSGGLTVHLLQTVLKFSHNRHSVDWVRHSEWHNRDSVNWVWHREWHNTDSVNWVWHSKWEKTAKEHEPSFCEGTVRLESRRSRATCLTGRWHAAPARRWLDARRWTLCSLKHTHTTLHTHTHARAHTHTHT